MRFNDTQTGMPSGIPEGAMCVQRFDDSLNSAIHITYRILLRSSSMPEPRDPLLKVLKDFCTWYKISDFINTEIYECPLAGAFQLNDRDQNPPRQQIDSQRFDERFGRTS